MSDDWATPDWLRMKFAHYYDPFPLGGLAEAKINERWDGMKQDWISIIQKGKYDGLFLNGPHSKPLPWVLKGIEAAAKGIKTVMLLQLDSSTQYHRALTEAGFHPFGAFERIRYSNSDNGGQYANVLWFSPEGIKP